MTLIEAVQPRPLDRADVDEDILPAAIRLNEAESLGGVEPLNRACSHYSCPSEWPRECVSATLPNLSGGGNLAKAGLRWMARERAKRAVRVKTRAALPAHRRPI